MSKPAGNGDGKRSVGAILVVGGGIGGMQASLDLANAGFKVYLVERSPSIGGRMAQLDKTFPTNDCSMCTISPKLIEVAKHLNIDLITYSDVESIEGESGNFTVRVKCRAKSVDYSKCTGCGLCSEKCPTKVDSEFEAGIGKRKAIYVPYPQAVPNKPVIDREHCMKFTKGKCGVCQKKCPTGAIDYEQKDEIRELKVGAVILAPGYDPVDASVRPEYGFGRYKNVITSLQYERLLSASGPTQGHIKRSSDGVAPRRIAWIQCVGSRDKTCGNEYCSSVCCMYATKEAIMTAEHEKEAKCTIFFNDIRAFGKGFERYYIGAEKDNGVSYIRGIVSTVREMQKTKNLLIKYASDDGEVKEEEFDLVVLSVGLKPSADSKRLAEIAGIKLDSHGYALASTFSPNRSSRPGVFVCGAFLAPMDIPETVMTASSAAAASAELVAQERGSLAAYKTYPDERDVAQEEPRVGVFVCRCGTNIARVVDVPKVVEYARTLPYVKFAAESLFSCSTDTQKIITDAIKENNLNRVIVAACTPATHEPLFQDTLKEAGLNKFLFEMANIRNQCSWVHQDPELATEKSKDLVRMAVARALTLESIKQLQSPVTQKALVIGGGLSGMTAALSLARQGFEAYLVEKSDTLGGFLNRLHYTLAGDDAQKQLKQLVNEVNAESRIKVFTNAEVTEFSGHVGSFHATIKTQNKKEKIDIGAVIVATGASEYKPAEYLYGQNPNVLTQLELEHKIATEPDAVRKAQKIVMIQCVGSRDQEHQYCSRVCCGQAVKNALKLKELNPAAKVYVLHRDIRTYAGKELLYRDAREKGVLFLRYDLEHKPEVSEPGGALSVKARDVSIGATLNIRPDLVVLSTGIVPHETNTTLGPLLKVSLDRDGFYLEAHLKLRPLDFASEGMFLCGLAHSPKYIEESIAQARGAASRAAHLLSKDSLTVGGVISVVDGEKCVACLTCVRVCPYGVPAFNQETGVVYIEPASCQGCGICAGACPNKAIEVQHYKDRQVIAKCDVLCEAKN
ncbi:MAG: CoB--CoM heterodisulfide reductase iron-sulfur subunit A family protein [Candidatus Abyssobacteria bacterium SURF_5]|uniref:CoB--CoM heterodisulfide reductase iron-sulfur subunit A family protein n=1 Tax=Abyssobacteria bacterium (strain SURF_5) TaxID=2093360 RepID=A0A3A4NR98_ABYX5|nr:MAG: CoB--CoM heterodisulfide reductase iron-sulfur subunit A family protein [Candidatus Abyssubacteria bacterium SURF_5]